MRSVLVLPLVLVAWVLPAQAQYEPVPDTLDWHGYFPLSVGNLWQYSVDEFWGTGIVDHEYYRQWYIASDSMLDGQQYFVLEETCQTVYANQHTPYGPITPCDPSHVERHLIRYDDEQANVLVHQVNDQTNVSEQPWWSFDFRLDAAFGAETVGEGGVYSYLGGLVEYTVAGQRIEAHVKHVNAGSAVPFQFEFAHGIGYVAGGGGEGLSGAWDRLVYAWVDGAEYGQQVHLHRDEQPDGLSVEALTTYPNPFTDELRVRYEIGGAGVVELTLYDLLGRRVWGQTLGPRAQGVHQERLSGIGVGRGVYGLVLTLDGRVRGVRRVVAL